MASGFSAGGGPDFYTVGNGINNGRSASMMSINNTPQVPYRSTLAGIIPDPASHSINRRSDLNGKRSLTEFQQQQHQLLQQHQQFQFQQQQQQHQHQQQMVGLGALYNNLRNVKPRVNYGPMSSSPISPLSPVDLSSAVSSLSPELSSISSSSLPMNSRFGLPILQQQLRQQQQQLQQRMNNLAANSLANGNILYGTPNRFSSPTMNGSISFPNSGHLRRPAATVMPITTMGMSGQQLLTPAEDETATEKKMLNRLHELEKELLDDDENCSGSGSGDAVSVVTNSEWSDTINNLNLITTNPNQNKAGISPSPTSSSSSCSSTSASPPIITCPRQSISDVATAISECRMDAAVETLTRLTQVSNFKGTSEQRLTAYMASALRSRVNPTEYPPPVSELYNKDHAVSTQMLYEVSPCFKLGFMAANLAILEAVSESDQLKVHVIDFDIQGGQYLHLLHALAGKKGAEKPAVLKITSFVDFGNGEENRLKAVGDELAGLAKKLGVTLCFNVMSLKINELSREKIGVEPDEPLAVNFAFKLYKLPDESVSTDNLRDEVLRRVKALSPKVVTLVEQEMNSNTAPFVSRVNEACGYYGVLFESLDATVAKDSSERVRIEEGLGRKMANSVACEGRDRVERCEVFGKWRARLSMAGFEPKLVSPLVADSLRFKLNSGPRGNPGFTVNEQSGGICFGWMGRTLAVASAWR